MTHSSDVVVAAVDRVAGRAPGRAAVAGARAGERGLAALTLVVILLPIMFIVGSHLQTMSGRNQRLQLEIREEQAMLTAEAGVDVALNEARKGNLLAGHLATYTFDKTLPLGGSVHVVCTYLGDDDRDNDGDGHEDADDPKEDVFMVESTGTYLSSQRRVAVYLGYTTLLPDLEGAVTVTNPAINVDIAGSGQANGNDHLLDGTLSGGAATYGIAIAPPGTLVWLQSQVTGGEMANVTGAGASPSLGAAPDEIDVTQLVDFARQSASVVITNSVVSAVHYGTATSPVVAYREGDVRIQGNSNGYGLLVVNGSVRLAGMFRWYGVIICTGTFECGTGNARVYGGVLEGPSSADLILRGTIDVLYSSTGVTLAGTLMGRYVAFNGWQETSTNDH